MEWGNPIRRRANARRTWWQHALGVLLAAMAFAPLPAAAQQGQSYAIVRSEILDSITVINNADMYFGVISPGTANGVVVMTPDDQSIAATCTTTSGIVRTGPCRAARFQGSLPFIFNLQITKPAGNQITLTGPSGATMRVHDFTFAKGTPWMLGGSATNPNYTVIFGNFIVYVGGTLDVARTQRAGVYNGSFTLSFNYN
jgi:hypothetical protein